jgi:hypothetical protein
VWLWEVEPPATERPLLIVPIRSGLHERRPACTSQKLHRAIHDLDVEPKRVRADDWPAGLPDLDLYFTSENGMRTALIFFEMADSSGIPAAAEPFFMGLDADITFAPMMNADEMRASVDKAMEAA